MTVARPMEAPPSDSPRRTLIPRLLPLLLMVLVLAAGCDRTAPPDPKPDSVATPSKQVPIETADPTTEPTRPCRNTAGFPWRPDNNEVESVQKRIEVPEGFARTEEEDNSFACWLRCLPLKPKGAKVMLCNGQPKSRQDLHAAVIDIDVGKRDLQQCADAVMRLRAEYLFAVKKHDKIHFNFTSGDRCDYSRWRRGERPVISGNHVTWQRTAGADQSHASFRKYMDKVFMYAGTLSLAKELKPIKVISAMPGDVFIQGGSPGHAVIVLDVATHPKTRERICLLAQSYMPAQSIHILKNLEATERSPWFSLNRGARLLTPEWTFKKTDLRRFP